MRILDQLGSPLVRRALLEAALVGALCGVIGVHVLLRRLPFFTLALSHATFPGVVIASMLGASVYVGGGAAAVALVVAVAVVGSARRLDASTATGVALAGAFALGVVLQSSRRAGSRDLAAFLVGDVLNVSAADILATLIVGAIAIAAVATAHKELVFAAFDPAGAEAVGYRALPLDLLVLAAIATTVVTSVRAVGTILVVSLLVAPSLTARVWVDRVGSMMALGAAFGALAGVVGVAASTQWDVAGGAAITLVATAVLLLSLAVRPALQVINRAPARQ